MLCFEVFPYPLALRYSVFIGVCILLELRVTMASCRYTNTAQIGFTDKSQAGTA